MVQTQGGFTHIIYGICVDDSGAVYVVDFGNSRVQVF